MIGETMNGTTKADRIGAWPVRSRVIVAATFLAIAIMALPSTANAHQKSYVQPNVVPAMVFGLGELQIPNCGDSQDPVLDLGVGAVCFGTVADGTLPPDYPTASDCVPAFGGPFDSTGECSINIVDDLISPVAARYCQDLNDDLFCGGQPGEAACCRTEPRVVFCDALAINTPIDSTPRATGTWIGGPISDPLFTWSTNNWDPNSSIYVFFLTVTQANLVGGVCGSAVQHATHGFVIHS